MDDALADWLALREPTDAVSRSATLTQVIADRIGGQDPLAIVDLGTGAGSNIRYLAERLPSAHQRWLVIDRSADLLRLACTRSLHALTGVRAIDIEPRQLDLDTIAGADIFRGTHLVTASALLDLVSERWLESLAARCAEAGVPAALFTIIYDGRSLCSPADEDDEAVVALFNRHQHRDKGIGGPAAGPDAAAAAVRAFAAAGYDVRTEPSDWTLGPQDIVMQRELIDGWAAAAAETDPGKAARIAAWRERRLAHIAAGRSHLVVGHYDVAATLR